MSDACDAARREPPGAVDIGMRHGSARIRLEGERLGEPLAAEIAEERVVIALGCVGEPMEQAVGPLEHGARTTKAVLRHQGGAQTRLRRPAGMHAFGPGALGKIFDDAGRHAAGDAERIDDAGAVKTERRRDARGRRHGAEHRGRVKTRLVHAFGRDEAQPAHGFDAGRDADERGAAVRAMPLARRQHRRHDDGAGMHRPALERVVEILAMGGGAVDESGAGGAKPAGVADRRARPVIVAGRKRRRHVILAARREAQADNVDRQIPAFHPHRGRNPRWIDRRDAGGEFFRDGCGRAR